MKEFYEILQHHANTYPKMQPADGMKLVYQSVFGGGHMIPSEQAASQRLFAEYQTVSHDRLLLTEELGGISRVYLDTPRSRRQLALIAKLFCASARHLPCGYADADDHTKARFEARIEALRQTTADGRFAFDLPALDRYLADYRQAGYPAVSHSDAYRAAYLPAYRVIDSRYVRLLDAIEKIDALLTEKKRVVVAIDGRCASGKTTAAALLAEIFLAQVVHMDDFFLPPALRTPKRMAEVGGNLHRERFLREVIPHLRGGAFSYTAFDCSKFDYSDEPRRIASAPLILCEGSYALHPDFGQYFDLALFSDISPKLQRARILARNGETMLRRFVEEWIPMEEQYFDVMRVRERCDMILSS